MRQHCGSFRWKVRMFFPRESQKKVGQSSILNPYTPYSDHLISALFPLLSPSLFERLVFASPFLFYFTVLKCKLSTMLLSFQLNHLPPVGVRGRTTFDSSRGFCQSTYMSQTSAPSSSFHCCHSVFLIHKAHVCCVP